MKLLVALLLLAAINLDGCTHVRTYTFKKDRVDQNTKGNRGYIKGTPPAVPAAKEVPQRTMIGVDIEIGLLPGEKVELAPDNVKIGKVQLIPKPEPKPKKPVVVEETIIVEEEEWVK